MKRLLPGALLLLLALPQTTHAAGMSRQALWATDCAANAQHCVQTMLHILNKDRSAAGLAPLSLNPTQSLGTATCVGSMGHSIAMATSGTIWHTNSAYPRASFPHSLCVSFTAAGENVGESSSGNTPRDLHILDRLMMGEPHDARTCSSTVNHACNILDAAFHHVGIGIYVSNGTTWLTEDFTS